MRFTILIICLSINCIWSHEQNENEQPEQIHLSYGAFPSQMIVTWTTLSPVNESFVEFGTGDKLDYLAFGTVKKFKNNLFFSRDTYIHQVLMTGLIPGQQYRYRCGSPIYGWSNVYFFKSMPEGQDWSPKFAVFGDMGSDNAQSLPRLLDESKKGYYDAILHIGDFAYDMDNDDGRVGDSFMNKIQPIAAHLPYMTSVGNHEWLRNFSHYVNRFNMPNKDGKTFGGDNNHFYSFNIGPVHIISFSTEFYYFFIYGLNQIERQYEWLKEDLINANKPENRQKQPWIITMAHRPMYCTNANSNDCTKFDDRVRVGFPYIEKYGLEELFYEYGVDVEFWAHEHSYERLWPIYNYAVLNGSEEEPYRNPKAPVHITTGSAGCKENHDLFRPSTNFTAFRSTDYGYTRMQVFNSSHLYMEQVSDDKGGKVIDSLWLIKDKHGPYKN